MITTLLMSLVLAQPVVMTASWYGHPHHGRRTASGERFNKEALTCAHKTLPFGTKLRVTNNDKTVTVIVNDRGPFIKGRDLDLSEQAARVLGMHGQGVSKVTVERIK